MKKHYFFMVILCLFAALLTSEFGSSLAQIRDILDKSMSVEEYVQTDKEADEEARAEGGLVRLDASSVLKRCIFDGLEAGTELSNELRERMIEQADNPALGRTRGVLSGIVNQFSSGALWVTVLSALREIVHSDKVADILFIADAFLIYFIFWFFIKISFVPLLRRVFLEARIYDHVPYDRLLYFIHVKRWVRASLTMLVNNVLLGFWYLTIIGAFIKPWSYFMVPYIVAENPDIKPLEAISLSRRMMDGHKWDCFLKNLSFIGWDILGVLSFGLTDFLFTNPYKTAAFSEYYAYIRREAIDRKLEGSERLNDSFLFEKAPESVIRQEYARELSEISGLSLKEPKRNKVLAFLAKWAGLILVPSEDEKAYEDQQIKRLRMHEVSRILEGDAYPVRLSPFKEEDKNKRVEGIYYDRNYTVASIAFIYLLFSFVGWIWEGSIHMLETGEFINRGVLHGPWIPIYGTGCVLTLLLLKRLRDNPPAHFLATVLLCGVVEYLTGLSLELAHGGEKWWDYSGYFLNIQGRVCAEGLIAFGIGGTMVVYLIAPLADSTVRKIPYKIFALLVAVLFSVFLADDIYSSKYPNMGAGVTDISTPSKERGADHETPALQGESESRQSVP